MAYNESQQPRFAQAVARLHDVKGNPAPQITPEIGHGVTLEQTDFATELAVLTGRRNIFVGVTAPAIAAVSTGVLIQPSPNSIVVVTGVQVQKATAGFASVQVSDSSMGIVGTFATSFAFFRDTRLGLLLTGRPGIRVFTHLTGALPAAAVLKRVQLAANVWTQIPITPGYVMHIAGAGIIPLPLFGVFNETLNEAMDVMIDCYERHASPSELTLPQ